MLELDLANTEAAGSLVKRKPARSWGRPSAAISSSLQWLAMGAGRHPGQGPTPRPAAPPGQGWLSLISGLPAQSSQERPLTCKTSVPLTDQSSRNDFMNLMKGAS